ncbi:DUF6471 domain-containing protein [Mesorhizobium caraganae]
MQYVDVSHTRAYVSKSLHFHARAIRMAEKTDYEALAANLLKAELKRKGVTYAQLVERLNAIGVDEKEVNVRNKLSRGKFTAAFLLQCLSAIGSQTLHLG